jgi:hypothetical protein
MLRSPYLKKVTVADDYYVFVPPLWFEDLLGLVGIDLDQVDVGSDSP